MSPLVTAPGASRGGAAEETAPLDLDTLADEIIRTHRLMHNRQPVAAAVQAFVRQVGPERMPEAYEELIAQKLRQRIAERAQETPRLAADTLRRETALVRVQPPEAPRREPDVPDVPEPESREEFRPGAMLRHTTETGGYDGKETVETKSEVQTRQAPPIPDMLAGILRKPEAAPEPGATQPKVTVRQQPSWRGAGMRTITPEETWGALADMVDVGGASKQRKDLTDDDLTVIISLADSDEKQHARLVTEAYQRKAKARMERDALRLHDVKSLGELPDHALNRLYARREP